MELVFSRDTTDFRTDVHRAKPVEIGHAMAIRFRATGPAFSHESTPNRFVQSNRTGIMARDTPISAAAPRNQLASSHPPSKSAIAKLAIAKRTIPPFSIMAANGSWPGPSRRHTVFYVDSFPQGFSSLQNGSSSCPRPPVISSEARKPAKRESFSIGGKISPRWRSSK